jgi:hypothetical protein
VTTANKISIVQQSLASTGLALRMLIKDCTPDELPGATAVAAGLDDADRRMLLLGARMRSRLAGGN